MLGTLLVTLDILHVQKVLGGGGVVFKHSVGG